MKALLKRHLTPALLDIARRFRDALPLWAMTRKGRWIRREYWQFGQDQRSFVFMSIARFLHINRPVPGYYFEFGCNEANTMRKAWDHFQHLFDLTYVGFDSFEGLPEIAEVDQQPIWEKGKLAFAERRFINRVLGHDIFYGRDPVAIKSIIQTLCESADLVERVGKNARKKWEELFQPGPNVDAILEAAGL